MKQTKPTIVLTGGGSGGHITPLLSLAHALKRIDPDCRIIYIGLKGDKLDGLKNEFKVFDSTYFVTSGKFRRYYGESFWSHLKDLRSLLLNIRDFFKVLVGTTSSYRLLGKLKPDVVFLKGGYVGVPVGIAARLRRRPIVTHDSDAVAGLANRIAGRWAVIHATGMPIEYYNYPRPKTRYVGIPISDHIKLVTASLQKQYRRELKLPENGLVLLAAGGGLGSQRINDLVLSVAPDLLSAHPELVIVHVTGSKHLENVQQRYDARLGGDQLSRVKVIGFTTDFYKYSGAADLIIARSGATTMAEFAVAARACVIIPSPFLAAGHQLKNAQQLRNKKAAEVIDNNIAPANLFKVVSDLLENDGKRAELAAKLSATARPKAAEKLAKIILAVANNEEVPA